MPGAVPGRRLLRRQINRATRSGGPVKAIAEREANASDWRSRESSWALALRTGRRPPDIGRPQKDHP